ncbi:hypothetical protein F477_03625 [Pseudomonas sp. URIL14HWK12:I3]|nr:MULTISPECIES: hypothetical protein [unclassified Pseudomonas]PZW52779.1 hypothetical protein F478_02574 [Pseudomonas sp. URIL14HWK12:I2]PZW53524.1 hypothetical protein F477_03625 [Pseudomonas sp. URIL14HWK12:I3]
MTWTISDTAWALLLAIAVTSTWCVIYGSTIANRLKKGERP